MNQEEILLQATRVDGGCSIAMSCTPAEFVAITSDLVTTIIQRVTADHPELNQSEVFADMLSAIAESVKDSLKGKGSRNIIDFTESIHNLAANQDLN